MSRRRKICIFMGEITLDFQKEYCMELMSVAKERDIDVVLMASFGAYMGPHGRNMFFEMGEKNIMNLPVYSEYDGIVVCADTFDITGMEEEFWAKIKRDVKCPVVCLRSGDPDFPIITVDNRNATKDITNHFIKEHGFTRLCYMSGPLDSKDGRSRYDGFVDAMRDAGLPIRENTVFEGNYWKNLNKQAVDLFLDCPQENRPQVIICANDYMAVSIVDELRNRGIRIPEDICVCGFDDVPDSRTSIPPLTTVKTLPADYMYKTLEIFDKLWAGEPVEHINTLKYHLVLRESCGCGSSENSEEYKEIMIRLGKADTLIRDASRISSDYQTNFTLNNAFNVANFHFPLLDCSTGYLCLCDEEDPEYTSLENEQVYSNNMILRMIMHKNRNMAPNFCNLKFKRSRILPRDIFDDDYPNFKIVFQIHFRTKAYGYLVIVPKPGEWPNLFAVTYLDSLAFAIESSFMEEQFNQLSEIKRQYVIDPLTDIYNRRGFEQKMQKLLTNHGKTDNVYVSIVSIDMDNLKLINDKYGHAEGDIAIKGLADSIKRCNGLDDFCARTGGDEFISVIVAKSPDKFSDITEKIAFSIEEKSKELNKPYKLHASIGYSDPVLVGSFDLIAAMKIADDKMYDNKRKYKMERQ